MPVPRFHLDNDGSFKRAPCAWDFDHNKAREFNLPELRVGHFAGFVFVTKNADAPPLEKYIAPLGEIFARWRLEECTTAIWVGKVIKANWKVVSEAFM